MRKPLWIRYGGSNRKMDRDRKLLRATFPELFEVGSVGHGHWSNRSGTINDTPENREKIKAMKGISIDREMNKLRSV